MQGARAMRYSVVTQARAALILTFSRREKERMLPLPLWERGGVSELPQTAVQSLQPGGTGAAATR